MLVLQRKLGESIIVGHVDTDERLVEISVHGLKSNAVQLGIKAAKSLNIHRAEVWAAIRQETKRAENLFDRARQAAARGQLISRWRDRPLTPTPQVG